MSKFTNTFSKDGTIALPVTTQTSDGFSRVCGNLIKVGSLVVLGMLAQVACNGQLINSVAGVVLAGLMTTTYAVGASAIAHGTLCVDAEGKNLDRSGIKGDLTRIARNLNPFKI